jgi:hypothetical protein
LKVHVDPAVARQPLNELVEVRSDNLLPATASATASDASDTTASATASDTVTGSGSGSAMR